MTQEHRRQTFAETKCQEYQKIFFDMVDFELLHQCMNETLLGIPGNFSDPGSVGFYYDKNRPEGGYQIPQTKDIALNVAQSEAVEYFYQDSYGLGRDTARALALLRVYVHERWHAVADYGDEFSGYERQEKKTSGTLIHMRAMNEAVTELLAQQVFELYTKRKYGFIEGDQNIGYTSYVRLVREMIYAAADYNYRLYGSQGDVNKHASYFWTHIIRAYMSSDAEEKESVAREFEDLFGADFMVILSGLGVHKNIPQEVPEESLLRLLSEKVAQFRSQNSLGDRQNFAG